MRPLKDPSIPPPSVARANARRQHPVLATIDGEPVLVRAEVGRDGRTATVRCPFCRRRHVHGIGSDGTVYGLRTSHCTDRQPRAYVLAPVEAA